MYMENGPSSQANGKDDLLEMLNQIMETQAEILETLERVEEALAELGQDFGNGFGIES